MSKDAIIKILITIIALMVFIWLWHIISRMIIGTLIPLRPRFLSVLICPVDSNRGSGGNHCVCC